MASVVEERSRWKVIEMMLKRKARLWGDPDGFYSQADGKSLDGF